MKTIVVYLITCSLAMSQLVITKFDSPDPNGFTGKVELLNDVTFNIVRSGVAERMIILDWIPELSKIDESSSVSVNRGFPLSYELNGVAATVVPYTWYVEDAPEYNAFDVRKTNDGHLEFQVSEEDKILVTEGDTLTIKKFSWLIQNFDENFHEDAIGTFDGELYFQGGGGQNLSDVITLQNKFVNPDGAIPVASIPEKALYLEFQTEPGSSYGLHASDDLSNWVFTGDELEGDGNLRGFFIRTNKTKEFFQVLKLD